MRAPALAGFIVLAALAACTERTQTVNSGPRKQADTPSWQAASSPFTAAGYAPGDKANWEKQLRARAQGQNDFANPH